MPSAASHSAANQMQPFAASDKKGRLSEEEKKTLHTSLNRDSDGEVLQLMVNSGALQAGRVVFIERPVFSVGA